MIFQNEDNTVQTKSRPFIWKKIKFKVKRAKCKMRCVSSQVFGLAIGTRFHLFSFWKHVFCNVNIWATHFQAEKMLTDTQRIRLTFGLARVTSRWRWSCFLFGLYMVDKGFISANFLDFSRPFTLQSIYSFQIVPHSTISNKISLVEDVY